RSPSRAPGGILAASGGPVRRGASVLMVRRSLGAALWTLVGLLAVFLGALSSLVGTEAGRQLLARVTESGLRQVFTGTVEIGAVRGSLFTGLSLGDVRLFDADTTLVAWLPRVEVNYNPFDFAAGRVVLFELDLKHPVISIVQRPVGRRAAQLGQLQVPSPRESAIRIAATRLGVESDDPPVRLVDVSGRLRVRGDSLDVQLARVRLPATALRDARGLVSWPHNTLLFDLRMRADSASLKDVRFIDRRFGGGP